MIEANNFKIAMSEALQDISLFTWDNYKDSTAAVSGPELLVLDVSSKNLIDISKSKNRVYTSS